MPLIWAWEKVEVSAFSSNIDEINAAIQSKGGRWFAKETPLSNLKLEKSETWDDGMELELPGMPVDESFYAPLSLPSSFDWANNGGNFVTSIKNQDYPYGCGSCFAFAATAALESKALITFNMPGTDLDLSEQILMSCSGSIHCAGLDGGATPLNYLRDTGTSLESCYPYTATDGDCRQACANWQANTYRIDGWSLVVNGDKKPVSLSAIKNALYTNGPVISHMLLYQDFLNYGGGVYSHTWGDYFWTHSFLIVGWDDSLGAFRCKNSWGTSWGESGFFWIDYAELYGTGITEFGKWVWTYGNAIHHEPNEEPNLTLYKPTDWSDKIVVSNSKGTNTDGSPLYTTDTLYVDWAVKNASSVAITSGFYTALYVDEVLKTSWHSNSLSAGDYEHIEDYSIGSLSDGTHALKIVTDYTGVIGESNEGDNEYIKTITIVGNPAGPDLTGAWTTPLTQACRTTGKGQKCTLKGSFTVSNIGNRDASSTYVEFYLSDNATYEEGDTQLKSLSTGKLKPGKGKAINVNYNVATNQTATGKYIIVVIDPDDIVKEIDETNNIVVCGPIP